MHTADLGVACSFTFSVGRWIRWEVGCWLDRIASSLLFFSFLFFSFLFVSILVQGKIERGGSGAIPAF